MSNLINILIDSAFISINIEPTSSSYLSPRFTFGFHFGSLVTRRNTPSLIAEIVPNYLINVGVDLDKMEFLKLKQRDPLIRLPTLNVIIDPRFADYLHQLYPLQPIPPGQASTNFSPSLHSSWPLNRFGRPIGILSASTHDLVLYKFYIDPCGIPRFIDENLGIYQHARYLIFPHIHIGVTTDLPVLRIGSNHISLRPTFWAAIIHVPNHPSFGITLEPQYHKFLTLQQNPNQRNLNVSVRPSLNFTFNNLANISDGVRISLKFDFVTCGQPSIEPSQIEQAKNKILDDFITTVKYSFKHPELNIKEFKYSDLKIRIR